MATKSIPRVCAGCANSIKDREYLACSTCKSSFDLLCANLSEKYYKNMTKEQKKSWTCQICRCKQPKSGNSNTPIRSLNHPIQCSPTSDSESNDQSSNITFRNKTLNNTNLASNTGLESAILLTMKQEIQVAVNTSVKLAMDSFFSKEFNYLKSELKKLNDLKQSVEFLSSEYDRLQSNVKESNEQIKQLTQENSTLSKTVESLSTRINLMEQHSRESNIEIHGVPESKSENLYSLVNQIGSAISQPLMETDILSCTRVRKLDDSNKRPRTIVVKLRNTKIRDTIIAAVQKFNKNKPNDRLNTSHLGYGSTKSYVFISEHLAPYYKALHARTRQVAKEKRIKYVWVRNGRIYVRKDDQSPAKQIKCYDSLNSL